jgi:hypothetical protein
LNEQDTLEVHKVLIAASELLLNELIDYLQKYLIENKANWLEKHFELIHRTSFKFNNLLELQKFCTEFMVKSPDKIFKSLDFTSLPEKSLVSLLKRDDLQMKEIEVWEHVLKWGLTRNPTITPDPSTWADDDFKTMENTLQHCLPLIRFYSLSSKDFLEKVHTYKKLLRPHLYEDLLKYYLDFNNDPNNNFLPPRSGNFDSKIVNLNIISQISKWIDKVNIDSEFAYTRELYLPYEFKLLIRGSRDGFTPNKFHSLCGNMYRSVTFIKVKGTDEILGGYTTSMQSECEDSFIFSFKITNNLFKDGIISNLTNYNNPSGRSNSSYNTYNRSYGYNTYNSSYGNNSYNTYNDTSYGPRFCNDLYLRASNTNGDYDNNYYQQNRYVKKIRDTDGQFSIEDYEVFQLENKYEWRG